MSSLAIDPKALAPPPVPPSCARAVRPRATGPGLLPTLLQLRTSRCCPLPATGSLYNLTYGRFPKTKASSMVLWWGKKSGQMQHLSSLVLGERWRGQAPKGGPPEPTHRWGLEGIPAAARALLQQARRLRALRPPYPQPHLQTLSFRGCSTSGPMNTCGRTSTGQVLSQNCHPTPCPSSPTLCISRTPPWLPPSPQDTHSVPSTGQGTLQATWSPHKPLSTRRCPQSWAALQVPSGW